MTVPANIDSEPRAPTDRKAEDAAKKVRRSAEIHAKAEPTEAEKKEAISREFEAHAELERKKHYRGNPGRE